MRIDRTQKKWLIVSLAILIASTGAYIPYAAKSSRGPSGASALGLTFGVLGFAFMVFAGLLGARKKAPIWRIGRAQTWMRGHLWLGLLSLPLILFHGGFRFGGPLTAVSMILLITVVLSGIFGALLQHYLPAVMTAEVPFETIFEQIDHVRSQLLDEADTLISATTATGGPLATSAAARAPVLPEEPAKVAEESTDPLGRFYRGEMRPFLEKSDRRGLALADSDRATAIFDELEKLLPAELHDTLRSLEDICEEERQLRHQVRLHHLLNNWLFIHIPLSLLLLLLCTVHALMALRY